MASGRFGSLLDVDSCCTCWVCPGESSSDSDSGDGPPLPPGLIPVRNDGCSRETQRLNTPAVSRWAVYQLAGGRNSS